MIYETHLHTLHATTPLFLVAGNPLSGTIPSQLGKLTNVINLSFGSREKLKEDRITGTLPTELGKLSMLVFFAISE